MYLSSVFPVWLINSLELFEVCFPIYIYTGLSYLAFIADFYFMSENILYMSTIY